MSAAFRFPHSALCLLPSDHLSLWMQMSTDIGGQKLEELIQDQETVEKTTVMLIPQSGRSICCTLLKMNKADPAPALQNQDDVAQGLFQQPVRR